MGDIPMAEQVTEDRQTVILLGASNLTLGWKPAIRALQATVPGPLDVRVSLGLGRSYVDWSGFWLRRLPGIANCGLWDSLPQTRSKAPLVLVTDLGNDIVYRHSPETIFQTATECIRRIQAWRSDARIVLTGLPLASLQSVGPVRFVIARSILFPGCGMPFEEIREKSIALDQSIRQFAQANNFPCIIPQGEWYRADPIHVIPSLREQVFRKFFSHWNPGCSISSETGTLPAARLPTSALRTIAGFERRAQQPVFQSPELVVSAW